MTALWNFFWPCIAAGILMVREAGGTVSDINTSGDALVTGHVVCGNEFVHGELVKILRK